MSPKGKQSLRTDNHQESRGKEARWDSRVQTLLGDPGGLTTFLMLVITGLSSYSASSSRPLTPEHSWTTVSNPRGLAPLRATSWLGTSKIHNSSEPVWVRTALRPPDLRRSSSIWQGGQKSGCCGGSSGAKPLPPDRMPGSLPLNEAR